MLVVFLRALILYAFVFLVVRLMGKRELSQIQPFEFVIIIMIADLASGPMSSEDITILNGIMPILCLLILYIIFTLIIQSNNKVEKIVCGSPAIMIMNGKINEKELRKQQYTVEELMSQIRKNGYFKITDVSYAILETNGDLNVIGKDQNINQIPLNIISDGKILDDSLKILKIDENYINQILKKKKIKMENILVGTIDENNQFIYQLKEERK